jgi:hypothetical protein
MHKVAKNFQESSIQFPESVSKTNSVFIDGLF